MISGDYGDPRLPQTFWDAVYPEPNTGCWLWGRSLTGPGYGQYYPPGNERATTGHRAAYLALVGPTSAGLQIDHLCRQRSCCNPAHLELVTNRENSLRSPFRRRKTHCANGHEYTPENTLWRAGEWGHQIRRCRACRNAQDRAAYVSASKSQ